MVACGSSLTISSIFQKLTVYIISIFLMLNLTNDRSANSIIRWRVFALQQKRFIITFPIPGFNKRLIDDILIESLESSGHTPMKDETVSPAERLRYNVQLLLEWTIPPQFMKRFREERRSTEELLEELTS